MERRQFISLVGGAAAVWPLAARAQQSERTRRMGVLISIAEADPEVPPRIAVLEQELQKLGWIRGREIQIEYRFGAGNISLMRKHATELVAANPDVIFASGTPPVSALQRATGTIPIVFVIVADPVGSGFAASLSQPDGNITGLSTFEYTIGGKWLSTLRELAPHITRVGVVMDRNILDSTGHIAAIQVAASSIGLAVDTMGVRDGVEIDKAIDRVAREPNSSLVFLPSPVVTVNRERIIAHVSQQRLPAIYPYAYFAKAGGLVSYGMDILDLYRRAAPYIDRILRGANPGELPIQQPTKFELVINLKTAKRSASKSPRCCSPAPRR